MISNEELVKLCQDVIRIPSPSGHEEKVSKFLKGKMEELGFDEVNIDRYGSVYGVIHGKRPGKTIMAENCSLCIYCFDQFHNYIFMQPPVIIFRK